MSKLMQKKFKFLATFMVALVLFSMIPTNAFAYNIGDKKTETFYISNDELTAVGGLGLIGGQAIGKAVGTKVAKKYLSDKLLKTIGGRFLPGVNTVSTIGSAIGYYGIAKGTNGVKITITYTWGEQRAWDTDQWVDYVGWNSGTVSVSSY